MISENMLRALTNVSSAASNENALGHTGDEFSIRVHHTDASIRTMLNAHSQRLVSHGEWLGVIRASRGYLAEGAYEVKDGWENSMRCRMRTQRETDVTGEADAGEGLTEKSRITR